MTILLGRKSDKEPFTCLVCARRAKGVGVCSQRGNEIGWLCDDPSCLEVAERIYYMAQKPLDRYEEKAISDAGQKVIDDLAEALLGAMWSKGIKDLSALDGDTFNAIATEMTASPEYRRAIEKVLTEYGTSIRHQLASGTAPF